MEEKTSTQEREDEYEMKETTASRSEGRKQEFGAFNYS
jgi:hypothetical protein